MYVFNFLLGYILPIINIIDMAIGNTISKVI